MKVFTPEISWHQKEPIFSVDFCKSTWKLASAGADFTVKIWNVKEGSEGNIGLDFLANLDRHSKPVNVVRFSPDGKLLASAGDDCIIIIWKLAGNGENRTNECAIGNEDIVNKETWTVFKMLRRGHLEDIYDLAWSPNGQQLISGSVDNSAIVWDVNKGHFTTIIKDHKHYVQGVCWDPRGQYVVTHSSDRTCRIYSLTKNHCVQKIDTAQFPLENPIEEGPKLKSCKLFMDETMQSFFRRCSFSPDGLLLVLPGGINDAGEKPSKGTYVFARGCFNKPALYLPGPNKATVAAAFCPITYENMVHKMDKENMKEDQHLFKLPYRMCYAVATLDSVIFYDTQHHYPFGFVSNLHYASLTDMTWSSDGRILVISSLDGYCSFITFEENELGQNISFDPMEYVTNRIKARREARKEAKKQERKPSGPTSQDREQTDAVVSKSVTPGKDQPTLDKFITPVRKRKRPVKDDSASKPTKSAAQMLRNDSPRNTGAIVDLTASPTREPIVASEKKIKESSNEASVDSKHRQQSQSETIKTPKRATLYTLGFQPIAKTPEIAGNPVKDKKEEKDQELIPDAKNAAQPRRISFTTLSLANKGTVSPNTAVVKENTTSAGIVKTLDSACCVENLQSQTYANLNKEHVGVSSSKPTTRDASAAMPFELDRDGKVEACDPSLPTKDGLNQSAACSASAVSSDASLTANYQRPQPASLCSDRNAVLGSDSKHLSLVKDDSLLSSCETHEKKPRRINFVTLEPAAKITENARANTSEKAAVSTDAMPVEDGKCMNAETAHVASASKALDAPVRGNNDLTRRNDASDTSEMPNKVVGAIVKDVAFDANGRATFEIGACPAANNEAGISDASLEKVTSAGKENSDGILNAVGNKASLYDGPTPSKKTHFETPAVDVLMVETCATNANAPHSGHETTRPSSSLSDAAAMGFENCEKKRNFVSAVDGSCVGRKADEELDKISPEIAKEASSSTQHGDASSLKDACSTAEQKQPIESLDTVMDKKEQPIIAAQNLSQEIKQPRRVALVTLSKSIADN